MTINFELFTTTLQRNGEWVYIVRTFEKNHKSYDYSTTNKNESTLTRKVIEEFIYIYPKMKFLLTKFKTFLSNDCQKFLKTNVPVFSIVEELEVNPEFLRKHMSCWETYGKEKGPFTRNFTKKNGIHSSCIKHTLENFEANSPAITFFTENSCPVCMASYKEIIEEDHHIVIPPCGHPVCCKCCDEILRNNGQCSRCRDGFDIGKFDTMVYDLNLQQIPHIGKIFY